LLTVLFVFSLLMALIVPAVQSTREAARRVECSSRLGQLGQAVHGFVAQRIWLPSPSGWRYQLLPWVGEEPTFRAIRGDKTPVTHEELLQEFSEREQRARQVPVIEIYTCPSSGDPALKVSWAASYHGCYASTPFGPPDRTSSSTAAFSTQEDGIFASEEPYGHSIRRRFADVVDGLSQTVMLSEVRPGNGKYDRLRTVWELPRVYLETPPSEILAVCESLPVDPHAYGYMGFRTHLGAPWHNYSWGSGTYNHALPPNRPSCKGQDVRGSIYTAGSLHPGGIQLLYGDNHLQFVNESIDRAVWNSLGSCNEILARR